MIRKNVYRILLVSISAIAILSCGNPGDKSTDAVEKTDSSNNTSLPANAVTDALPFTLSFTQQQYSGKPALPCLQSFVCAMSKQGLLLVLGGRRQGLHTFQAAPAKNFIPDSSNNFIYVISPADGSFMSFNVDSLPPSLSAPLQSTNQQFYHDLATDKLYVVGGYGWNAAKTDMLTFNTIISFKVEDMIGYIKSKQPASEINSLISTSTDDRFAVTGGELFKLNSQFYLVFGQKFTGQYRAFGGTDFQQKYTEEVRIFTLIPNTLKILSYGATTNTDPGHPFHRRDGNIIADIDPSNGNQRIAALGGVFQPGIIAPYTNPIYINNPSTPIVDTSGNQKFSQYECPVISIYDSSAAAAIYHTFFGGIGHYYYIQTPSQKAIYDTATNQGRNDGFPFVEDITSFVQFRDGSYKEFIHTNTTPGNRLIGASTRFILNRSLISGGNAYSNGVLRLSSFAAQPRLIGYIYGGIEAINPLPLYPNTGTFVSNSMFAVYLSNTKSAAIPASYGHEAVKADANLQRR